MPIPFSQPLAGDYQSATLSHDDYPGLIPSGQKIETVAAGAVLITYNWPKAGNDRYQRVAKFVESFFDKIDELKKAPRHPKWREVDLAAPLSGWTRFEAAQNWLDRHPRVTAAGRQPN